MKPTATKYIFCFAGMVLTQVSCEETCVSILVKKFLLPKSFVRGDSRKCYSEQKKKE